MRKVIYSLIVVAALLIAIGFLYKDTIERLSRVNSLFEPHNIVENFQDADEHFPTTDIPPSSSPYTLPIKLGFEFPETFTHQGKTYKSQDFIKETSTEGLLVIQADTIRYESYMLGLEPDEKHISWSMSKSFIGTLVGIAVEQGKLKLTDEVTTILPDFKGTGYEGVTVEDLLGMRSGVRFNEDYGDFNSDINRFGRAFAMGTSYRDFARSLQNEVPPGSRCRYVSIDTQVLGFLLSESMGQSLTELLQEYIWEPMGMEHASGWIVDNEGFEMALGGMTATLRDFAKLGLLYLNKGHLNGRQVVSSDWVTRATSRHPDQLIDRSQLGYGYQWWIPSNDTGDFMMVGIYDQFVYVHPAKQLVVAKLSADHRFKTQGSALKAQHISFFQEVARGLEEIQ